MEMISNNTLCSACQRRRSTQFRKRNMHTQLSLFFFLFLNSNSYIFIHFYFSVERLLIKITSGKTWNRVRRVEIYLFRIE